MGEEEKRVVGIVLDDAPAIDRFNYELDVFLKKAHKELPWPKITYYLLEKAQKTIFLEEIERCQKGEEVT